MVNLQLIVFSAHDAPTPVSLTIAATKRLLPRWALLVRTPPRVPPAGIVAGSIMFNSDFFSSPAIVIPQCAIITVCFSIATTLRIGFSGVHVGASIWILFLSPVSLARPHVVDLQLGTFFAHVTPTFVSLTIAGTKWLLPI